MFLWSARTLAQRGPRAYAGDRSLLETIAAAYGTPSLKRHDVYPKCENISVDYAVLEPRSAKGEHLSHPLLHPRASSVGDDGLLGFAL